MRGIAFASFLVALSLMVGSRAEAQEPSKQKYNQQAAKDAFIEARKAEGKKQWKKAAKNYGVAYAISKDASLFYYMANAFMNDGNCEFAIIYFNRFLGESQPKPETRRKTEGLVKKCKKTLGIKDEPKNPPDTGNTNDGGPKTTDPPNGGTTQNEQAAGIDPATGLPYGYKESSGGGESSSTSAYRVAGWVSLGLAAALGTGGTVLALTASAREDDINNLINFRNADGQPSRYEGALQDEYDDKVDEGDRYSLLSKVAFGAAGAAAVATVVFFVLDGISDDSPTESAAGSATIAPTVTSDGVGVAAGWSF